MKRNESYRYLGKLIAINGDDPKQVNEIISTYKDQVEKICQCKLPLFFKVCTLNNMALAKVLFFFVILVVKNSNSKKIQNSNRVRELFSFYKSAPRDVIYLSRLHGSVGVKQFSTVYYGTRVAFITKMLNHNEEILNIARESLKLDMKKRNINFLNAVNNFLGYEVNNDYYLASKTNFGCKTEWMELNRYCKKLNVKLQWVNNLATIIFNE